MQGNSCVSFQQCRSQFIRIIFATQFLGEQDSEPTVIKKANHFISFKFFNIELLDKMNFIRGARNLDSILKAYKTSETKTFFPYEWFGHPDKLPKTERAQCDDF